MATTKSLDADSCYQVRAVTEDDTGIEILYQPSNPNIEYDTSWKSPKQN